MNGDLKLQLSVLIPGSENARPEWTPNGVPMCTTSECSYYDGKRCSAMGQRPSSVCQPVVERMAEQLSAAVREPRELPDFIGPDGRAYTVGDALGLKRMK